MKITALDARVLRPLDYLFRWNEEIDLRYLEHVLLKISTDEGHEGICITDLMTLGEIESAIAGLRKLLIGRDPHEVEAISYKLTHSLRSPNPVASTVDICHGTTIDGIEQVATCSIAARWSTTGLRPALPLRRRSNRGTSASAHRRAHRQR